MAAIATLSESALAGMRTSLHAGRKPSPLGSHTNTTGAGTSRSRSSRSAPSHRGPPCGRRVDVERCPRGWPREDRAHGGAHGLRRVGVRAVRAEHHGGVGQRVRRADDRADVARVVDAVEVDQQGPAGLGPALPVHADHPRAEPSVRPRRAAPAPRRRPPGAGFRLRAPARSSPSATNSPASSAALLLELADRLELVVVG